MIKDLIDNKNLIEHYKALFNYSSENSNIIYDKFNEYINTDLLNIISLYNSNKANNVFNNIDFNNARNIFKDYIYDNFMDLLNIFINDNINNINNNTTTNNTTKPLLTQKETNIFKYKTIKFYYANRFSSLVEYFLFSANNDLKLNNENINAKINGIEDINKLHDINNINLLFFICASYALLDTYIDSDNFMVQSVKEKINEVNNIKQIFNQYFNSLLEYNDNYNNDSNDNNSDFSIINKTDITETPIIRILTALLEYSNIQNIKDKLVIETIQYCFNLEIECYYTQNNPCQTNNELISMMIKKGMSSLILSFLVKDNKDNNDNNNYLTQFINNAKHNNNNSNINSNIINSKLLQLIYDFGVFGQLIDDICDYIEDTNENKYVITSYNNETGNENNEAGNENNEAGNENNEAGNETISGYEISVLVYINKLLEINSLLQTEKQDKSQKRDDELMNLRKYNTEFMLIHIYILYYALCKCDIIVNNNARLYDLKMVLEDILDTDFIDKAKMFKRTLKQLII
jgi:hypothetical protein